MFSENKRKMGNFTEEIKIFSLNTTAFFVSFANIDMVLRLLLLLVSFLYTGYKLFRMIKEDIKDDE